MASDDRGYFVSTDDGPRPETTLEGLSQLLADEHEHSGRIRFNSLNPGATRTRMRATANVTVDGRFLSGAPAAGHRRVRAKTAAPAAARIP